VPTWNYIAVHAYGTLQLVEDEAGKDALLRALMRAQEPAFAEKWVTMPSEYRQSMLAGIMGFRIHISRIEGKFKLSQNRAPAERENVRAAHSAGSPDQQALAGWMERLMR
jgi:transcriptional regulator